MGPIQIFKFYMSLTLLARGQCIAKQIIAVQPFLQTLWLNKTIEESTNQNQWYIKYSKVCLIMPTIFTRIITILWTFKP